MVVTSPVRERPLPVRSRRAGLRRRVDGHVDFWIGRQQVTAHAGLELVREYLRGRGFPVLMRRSAGTSFPATDFGVVPMPMVLLGLILIDGRRVWHLRYELSDPVLKRFSGLARLPSSRTVSAWLQRITAADVERRRRLNSELVAEELKRSGPRRLTLDVDGSVASTELLAEGAAETSTLTTGRCRATTRSPPTRRSRAGFCARRTARGTSTTARPG